MKRVSIKWVVAIIALATAAFAQNVDIPEDAAALRVRVAMMGDILILETPDGLDELWLQCVHAPELKPDGVHEYMAVQARNFTRERVEGKDVFIVYEKPRDKPRRNNDGRLVGYVYYKKLDEVSGEMKNVLLNAELVQTGLAKVDTTYSCGERSRMYDLQRKAKRARKGIWSVPPR